MFVLGRWFGSLRAALPDSVVTWIGPVLALTVMGIAIGVLAHMLRDIAIADVIAAVRAVPTANLVRAAVFVLCAYATLTMYDWFALRTIGKLGIPYRVSAMASVTSYAIGHNIGATALSAGAIRYRIYSSRGLGAVDVAKICFVTGLTFWLGNFAVLGLVMSYDPAAVSGVNRLSPDHNRLLGATLLIGLVAYVVWVWVGRRTIGWKSFEIALPGGPSTLLQIAIGIADLTFCSLAMFMLVPAAPAVPFVSVAGVFVSATLLGFASHAPGSLGVFDAAMLIGLPDYAKEELIASLLIFRLMYFMLPFGLSLLVLGAREVMRGARRRAGTTT